MAETPLPSSTSPEAKPGATCAVIGIWEVLGKRWSLLIIKNLSTKETIRFNELKRALSGISSTVLSERLLELEREGLVTKKIYPEVPPRVEYSLTAQAKELEVIIKELAHWVARWKRPQSVASATAAIKKEEAWPSKAS
ncbi:MAG TPA: helix-turn-helix domain-containing protein [Nitrososphaera sp.]|nr:helix-turn-helix domain-containing protein [Nitrososphaera sp.]